MNFETYIDAVEDDETRNRARAYFETFWLETDEYFDNWVPIERSIFDSRAKHLPEIMFNPEFELLPLVGGEVFVSKEDFRVLQQCMQKTGDGYFVVVQNTNVIVDGFPFVRFKYPASVTWDELMSGGIVGSEHFQNGCKDYFVYGDSAVWGRYVANSWVSPENKTGLNPLNIMGFQSIYSQLFRENFESIRRLEPQITPVILKTEWLPQAYRELEESGS